jgi:hypothetical protein
MDENEEPITSRVQKEIERVEERRENLEYRRADDRRDWWIKTISTFFLGLLAAIVGAVIAWVGSVKEIQNKHEIFINRLVSDMSSANSDLRGLQETKNAGANLEKLINGQITLMQDRLAEQDKRWQMQGEGLIAGNKAIHEALQRIIEVNEEISSIKRQIRNQSDQDETPLNIPRYRSKK